MFRHFVHTTKATQSRALVFSVNSSFFWQLFCTVDVIFHIAKQVHFHDDIILLLRPESFRVLLSCANQGFCYLNLTGITKFKYERKNEKDSGLSSKMTPSCKWLIWSTVAGNDELRVGFQPIRNGEISLMINNSNYYSPFCGGCKQETTNFSFCLV